MRMGEFSRSQVAYGAALSIVKPKGGDPGNYLLPELLDPAMALTQTQQYDLQSRIDDLYSVLRGERDWYR